MKSDNTMDVFAKFDVPQEALKGVDVDAESPDAKLNEKEHALFNAASKGDLETVQSILLSNDVDVLKKHNGMNPAHVACMKGHSEIVDFLLSNEVGQVGDFLDAKTDDEGKTLLILGCQEGHLNIVKMLVAICAKTNIDSLWVEVGDNECGNNALHYSVWGGHMEVVKFLVEEVGMSCDTRNNEGRVAIDFAAAGDHLEVFEYLLPLISLPLQSIRSESGITPLHRCAMHKEGLMSVMTVILCRKLIDVNETTSNGSTPLHLAVQHGHEAAVYLLIFYGADVNKQNSVGFSACHFAAMKGYESILHLLVCYKADCNLRSVTGSTPVHCAAANGKSEIIEYLFGKYKSKQFKLNVIFDARDNNGATPADEALSSGYRELAERLDFMISSINSSTTQSTEDI